MKVLGFPKVFNACAVTCAMSRSEPGVGTSEVAGYSVTCMPDLPLSVSCSDLVAEQQADPTLKGLFEQLLLADVPSVVQGYYLQDQFLVRKWLSHGDHFE